MVSYGPIYLIQASNLVCSFMNRYCDDCIKLSLKIKLFEFFRFVINMYIPMLTIINYAKIVRVALCPTNLLRIVKYL